MILNSQFNDFKFIPKNYGSLLSQVCLLMGAIFNFWIDMMT